jgi:spermidine dehydrogenase
MDKITRRDFINGTLMVAGSAMLPREASSQAAMAALAPSYYPPALTGLRGSHPGSADNAHSRAWTQKSDWGSTTDLKEEYDLVVVGGGFSGLAAAYYYQQKHGADKKVLVLDNHDDFGGHAKRNELAVGDKMLIGYGGSHSITDARRISKLIADLFDDIGVDIDGLEKSYDQTFYRRHGLCAMTYFDKETFGEDKIVKHPYCNHPNYVEGLPMGEISVEEAAQQAPLDEEGKKQLLRVLNGKGEGRGSYFDYLRNTLGITNHKIMIMARNSALDWASSGTDTMGMGGARGAGAMGFPLIPVYDPENPYIYHYPEGNAGVVRALVKKMIPAVAEGSNAEELILSRFDYSQLDKPTNSIRIRLNSTVVNAEHLGDPAEASEVSVRFINDNQSYQVKGKGVVMACYNMMIPHIVSNLPEDQDAALRSHVKGPLQYTNVAATNWRAIKEIGLGFAMCPGKMHQAVTLELQSNLGGYESTKTPDDPCIVQMVHCPYGTVGAPVKEQYREARQKMLTLQFADYEEEIRTHLTDMLPNDLFDFDRDVTAITVNRWAHGYASNGPAVGRRPFGRITIANSDSVGSADAQAAIAQGHRAVNELG